MDWQPRDRNNKKNINWRPKNRLSKFIKKVAWKRVLTVLVGATVAIVGAVKLISYGIEWISTRQTSQEMRDMYYAGATAGPAPELAAATEAPAEIPTEIPAVVSTEAPSEISAQIPEQKTLEVTPAPPQAPDRQLPKVEYPGNPRLWISSRFETLRRENKDVIGWLRVGNQLDEPVVQRDNEFYLTHNAKGQKNSNGALFLDAYISLKSRPYTYIIYGHNMKSGAMFGSLRNYETSAYYHYNPFITFDTLYEEGRYVIFAIANINIVDFYSLKSDNERERQTVCQTLVSSSVHTCNIDVQPSDQLLVLSTCVDNDNERRVVVARRIRDGEDEKDLQALVMKSQKR